MKADLIYLIIAIIILLVSYRCLISIQKKISKQKRIAVVTSWAVYNMEKDACIDYLYKLKDNLLAAYIQYDRTKLGELEGYIEEIRKDLGVYSAIEDKHRFIRSLNINGDSTKSIEDSKIMDLLSDLNIYREMIRVDVMDKINLKNLDVLMTKLSAGAGKDFSIDYVKFMQLHGITDKLPEKSSYKTYDETIPCMTPRPASRIAPRMASVSQTRENTETSCWHYDTLKDSSFFIRSTALPQARKRLSPEYYNEHNDG